ncbi:MAG: hypothetical protein RL518_2730 [Pseudomonadota bacterium]
MVVRRHDIPGESLGKALRSVSERDTLTTIEVAELVKVRRELIDRLLIALSRAIEHQRSVLERVRYVALNVGPEAAQIRCDGRKPERKTLKRGVSPRFVVAREHPHVATPHELLVVKAEET